jgi:hypothetical protein
MTYGTATILPSGDCDCAKSVQRCSLQGCPRKGIKWSPAMGQTTDIVTGLDRDEELHSNAQAKEG